MRFFRKHSRLWGNLMIAAAVIGSNIGSAWAGMHYMVQLSYRNADGLSPYSAPANIGFQIMGCTVYPVAIILLIVGLYLRGKSRRP